MDYEQKYKEALQKIRELIERGKENGWTIISYEKDFEEIYPELQESDDEKIRNEICIYIGGRQDISLDTHNRWLDWLEKQGETFTKKDVDDAYLKGVRDTKQELEKQGENKQILDNSAKTCKNEPMFKVGDWIISNNKQSTYQVVEVKRGIYVIRDNADNHEYHIGIKECEKSGRLFTIQDAKDGDVLATEDWVFIFEKMKSNGKPTCYCHYDIELGFRIDTNSYIATGSKIYPAAKKQRDLLFQKMKEAGYEWNAEKKELRKFPTPADVGFAELGKAWEEETKNKKSTCWSEEDERMLEGIVDAVKDVRCQSLLSEIEIYDDYIEWLKSIKQRIGG